MKKVILFFALALASSSIHAQSYQLLNNHWIGDYYVFVSDLAELRNGDVVANISLMNNYPNGVYPLHDAFGHCLFKVSHSNAQIVDSVLIRDNYFKCVEQLLSPNPNGEDYILARIKSDVDCDNLCISRLDENLTPIAASVTVPLEESITNSIYFCMGSNDIIMSHPVSYINKVVFARYNLDGSLKNKVLYDVAICPVNPTFKSRMKVCGEDGDEYMVCGIQRRGTTDEFSYWLLDSTLHIIDSAIIHPNPTGIHFDVYEDNDIEIMDNESYLLATHFRAVHTGIAVSKRDARTQTDLKKLYFNKSGQESQEIIGLSKASDGNYFLVYKDTDLKVVKFDPDLNILWQRVYGFIDSPYTNNHQLIMLRNGGVAVAGTFAQFPFTLNPELFIIIINDDGTAGTPETEAFLRPYMFYPNPAQDQLHLQYSPDVQPTQIELFDLQGRLVRTQTNSLETLNLHGLATGQYLMKVTLANGKSYTDKVVKE